MASNNAVHPIFGNFGPSARLVPSLEAFISLRSIGSSDNFLAISSTMVSVASVELVAPGAL